MDVLRYSLKVEAGRDGIPKAALCLVSQKERWCVFTDSAGPCFRQWEEGAHHDFTAEDMRKHHQGIYRVLIQKWNALSAFLKEEPTA